MRKGMTQLWATMGMAMASVAVLGLTSNAYAISSCNATCSSNCSLSQTIACDNLDGIILTSGADLDLNGFGITCNSNCPQSAVRVVASNSTIKNTTGSGYITGGFTWAIDCQGNTNSEVTGVEFAMWGSAINECAKIHHNKIVGGRGDNSVGITSTGIANSDYIRDNYLSEFETAILVNSNTDVDISHNLVGTEEITAGGAASEVGINVTRTGSADIDVLYNFFFGAATSSTFLSTSGTVTIYGNSCDPANAICQTCSNCRQAGIPF